AQIILNNLTFEMGSRCRNSLTRNSVSYNFVTFPPQCCNVNGFYNIEQIIGKRLALVSIIASIRKTPYRIARKFIAVNGNQPIGVFLPSKKQLLEKKGVIPFGIFTHLKGLHRKVDAFFCEGYLLAIGIFS